jgi:DNA polymerase (family 10)
MAYKAFTNEQIAGVLTEMAAFWDMLKVDVKKRAYEMAASDVLIYPENLRDIYDRDGAEGLRKVPNVGPRIAKHIEELFKTGHFNEYEEFKKKFPINLPELLQLPGVGPRKIRDLWVHRGVTNLVELEKVCRAHKVRDIPGFGMKSEEKILKAIEELKS